MKTITQIITNKKWISLLFALVVFTLPALAQDGFGSAESDVPVDGGLSLLVAAGVGYGAKKIREKRKQ